MKGAVRDATAEGVDLFADTIRDAPLRFTAGSAPQGAGGRTVASPYEFGAWSSSVRLARARQPE